MPPFASGFLAHRLRDRHTLAQEPWRHRLAAIAEENRALYERHSWAAGLPASRPPLGPGVAAKYEHELRAFAGMGLDDVQTDSALTYLLGFVQAAARAAADGFERVLDGLGALVNQTAGDPYR
jgi:hypothetical protein